MAIKWIIKSSAAAVAMLVVLLYPEKAAALALLVSHTLWNIAVMIGENLHIPMESKAKAASAASMILLFPLRSGVLLTPSDHKEN
jgi:hypothetical protein